MQPRLRTANVGDSLYGFKLTKKEYVNSKKSYLYTLKHEKTAAELLYFDRADENKTFAISFKTLPEDNTGVFHILEHSVLNGSEKYPVKEPFVSMLQSSMQTFLNAMTFSDKTMYPVSSRNEKDFFNLTKVYLDAVFCPLIYRKPEIFMQEGWHYEFDDEKSEPFYNGVVYSEMKGVFSDVDSIMEDETLRLLFPDNCYGYVSGGHPENIPDLSYEQFTETHRRFYHPTNAKIFLDGKMNIDTVLEYIDREYLSKYDYREPDFDFEKQIPKATENTVYYELGNGEKPLAHMAIAKILCDHNETEKIFASKIIADYLTSSNESPLKKAFLESGLAQDIQLEVYDGIYQPCISLTVRNAEKENLEKAKGFTAATIKKLLENGLDKAALSASLERFAFNCKEISEPYGIELAIHAMEGWLYGDDPLTNIETDCVFAALREKLNTDYFENLLDEMLGSNDDKAYLIVLPSETKGSDDAKREKEKLQAVFGNMTANEKAARAKEFKNMQLWQQSTDSDEALATLPHLELADVEKEIKPTQTEKNVICNTDVLHIKNDTNGIVYLNMYFNASDLSLDELSLVNILTSCLGELRTENYTAEALQTAIKAKLGYISAKLYINEKTGELDSCTPYICVSASMLEENITEAVELIKEILLNGKYDETEKIDKILQQDSYFMKQALIGNGHSFAITKALSSSSAAAALREDLTGETFIRSFSIFADDFMKNSKQIITDLSKLAARLFCADRLFLGYSGNMPNTAIEALISEMPQSTIGKKQAYNRYDNKLCSIEIPASVGFSALGSNLYAMGCEFNGSCAVISSLITFAYLWNEVRVKGGAYGTGMNIRANGEIFCYSYRDPNLQNSKSAFKTLANFLDEYIKQGAPLDDVIIGTVNTTDPLLDPSSICSLMCARYLKGTTDEEIAKIRNEILSTNTKSLESFCEILKIYATDGKYCAVGDKSSISSCNK